MTIARFIFMVCFLSPNIEATPPHPPTKADVYIHRDPSTVVKKPPSCYDLMHLANAENTGQSIYGDSMRACFSADTFNIAPDFQKWRSAKNGYIGNPSGLDRPYLKTDTKGNDGAWEDTPYVKGTTLAEMDFGQIKGQGKRKREGNLFIFQAPKHDLIFFHLSFFSFVLNRDILFQNAVHRHHKRENSSRQS